MIEWLSQYSGYLVLVSFFAAFVGISLWAYKPSNSSTLEQHRYIPLKEVE